LLLVIVIAALGGLGVGWLSTTLPGILAAREAAATASPSPNPGATEASAAPTVTPDLAAITRDFDANDRAAGLNSLAIPPLGAGTFSVVPGATEPQSPELPVRWVRIEVEDGLDVDGEVFADFVMKRLTSDVGWSASGRVQFARSEGAADFVIALASPGTALAVCEMPHAPGELAAGGPPIPAEEILPSSSPAPQSDEDAATPSPSPVVTPAPEPSASGESACGDGALVVIDAYDWAAGFAPFEEDRTAARTWMVNHFVGHILGESDMVECPITAEDIEAGIEPVPAPIMVDQSASVGLCRPNPWPFPNALATPTPSPSPSVSPES